MTGVPFRIEVNSQQQFDILPENARNLDFIVEDENKYHLLYKGQAYHVELTEASFAARQFTFKINGSKFSVKIADHYERLVQQLGLNIGGSQRTNIVKAPMPGLVLKVMVEPGQSVKKGDPLLILEAMKMENVIKSAGDGRINTVAAQKGAAVEKGQILLEIE